MQSLRSFLSIRPFQVCLRRLQLRTPLTCVVILSFLVCKSSECSWPCDTSICEDMSGCEYGVVKDRCNCCDRCVSGPGQICGGSSTDYGPCAAGYECVPFPGYPHEEEEMLGTCTGKVSILKALFKFVLAELHVCCIVSGTIGQFLVE